MNRYPSRVFAVGEALYDKLQGVWPRAHMNSDRVPAIGFGDEDPAGSAESLSIVLDVDATTMEWRRLSPPGRDETIVYDVTFRTSVPNVKSSLEVWQRLTQVSAEIESITYDPTANAVVPLDVPGEVLAGLVAGVQPSVSPGPEGWVGRVTVSFRFQAQT